jgi:hypothetical protein
VAAGGWVEAYDSLNGAFLGDAIVDTDGSYTIDGLFSFRAYKLLFGGFDGAARQWSYGAATFNAAASIGVSQYGPFDVTAATVTLLPEGVIEGTFPSPPGFVGDRVCATAWYSDWYYVNEVCGEVGAAFALRELPAGNYYVEFTDDEGHRAPYSLAGDWVTESLVGVTQGSTVNLAMPTVQLMGSSTLEQPGTAQQVTVSVNPTTTGLAEIWIQSVDGGPWVKSTQTVQVTHGAGSFTLRPQGWMSVRVWLGGFWSNAVTFTPVAPTVALAGSASIVTPGTPQQATVSVSPAWSGTAELWVQSEADSPWVKSTKTVPVTRGTGAFTVYPSDWTAMRVVFMGITSDPITFTPVTPVVTLSGSASFVQPGTAQLVTVSVSPSMSGIAELWVQSEVDGAWVKSAQAVQVTRGAGSFTLNPSEWTSVRLVLFGATSNAVTFTPVAPVVTLSGSASFSHPGSAQRVTASVSPSVSGVAEVWVQAEDDGPWAKSSVTMAVVNGSGAMTMYPSGWTSVRVVLFGTSSNAVTLTPVATGP